MFARLDFPRFLVCCSGDLSDDESEEKPSVAICGGSICTLTGLVTLLTRIVTKWSLSTPENMPDNVARNVMGALGEGNKQHADFVAHRLQSTSVSFHAPIKMNKIHLRGNRHKYRNKSQHVNSTNEDRHLLRQLYITMHVRERNSDRLLEVENADCPPSLSKHSILRSDKKSDLLSCLEAECPSDFDDADAKLIDGAHMVHFFRPDASFESFRDYADKKAIPSIERQLANTKRVYVIWDGYLPDSLKATTRQRRGT